MLKNYWIVAWRNLLKNKAHSAINIVGLSVGMGVALLIGLWIMDELSFNRSFPNYDRLAQVMQNQTFNGVTGSQTAVPYLMGEELKKSYGADFKYISMASWTGDRILTAETGRSGAEKAISKSGNFMEPVITEMLSLQMEKGSKAGLDDPHSILLSASTAKALFGDTDPMNQPIKIDNHFDVKVTGVYADLPAGSDFEDLTFIAPWKLYIDNDNWPEKVSDPWRANAFQAYVQIAGQADAQQLSRKIRDVKLRRVSAADAAFKPVVFLHPMSKWHLYSEFKNGVNTGGRIDLVWLFGIIGVFVLMLACINFMNLSTARSEQRAKEVGIRKAIGSLRGQLISQFFAESFLVVAIAFGLSLLLVEMVLPYYNQVTDKKMSLPLGQPLFWLVGLGAMCFTALLAGSYPALYLSSFRPVKVLKGSFRVGRWASMPRKVLVVLQFTVSVTLIIGTVVVFRQIQFAKNRPVGYSRDGLLMVPLGTEDVHHHLAAVKAELLRSGAVSAIAESSASTVYINEVDNGFEWAGKNPAVQGNFAVSFDSHDFGKTVGWQFVAGRDFSTAFATDSTAMVLNEAAVKFMGLKEPVGETVRWDGHPFHVIGVIRDMVMGSPYEPVYQSVFVLNKEAQDFANIRINPKVSTRAALGSIEAVFKKYNPSVPFAYKFVDDEYARKFGDEERVGRLAAGFAGLAIFISLLGLFGMASFMAEQRVREIGVRKVLGASVASLWRLLSVDFVGLVMISLLIATPVAWIFMSNWLRHYTYRSDLAWWIFVGAGAGAMGITLLTVSVQAIRAAVANPVRSLRAE
jgi:putative ABC transport system permease protein